MNVFSLLSRRDFFMIEQDRLEEWKVMRIQITLTSPEGKRIIAKGIKAFPGVQKARKRGKILLKGGTTVSAVSEELCGKPMTISGMITPQGTLTSRFKHEMQWAHSQILKKGQIIPLLGLSGEPRNLIPCQRGSLSCKNHVGCLYKKGLRK
jgi:hypothetical protein